MSFVASLMPKLVSMLAIRSVPDLILKFMGIYGGIFLLGMPIDYLLYSNDYGAHVFDETWRVLIVTMPILGLSFTVVTHLNGLQQRLAKLAMTDMLTELPNRRAFFDRTNDIRQEDGTGTLFIIDADHFKRVNDTYGHAAGDACLRAIAQTLNAELGPDDTIGRLGGEEFAIFLPHASSMRIAQFGANLTKAIKVELEDGVDQISVTLSIGAAHGRTGQAMNVLFSRADMALYEAKRSGRAQMVIWQDERQNPLSRSGT